MNQDGLNRCECNGLTVSYAVKAMATGSDDPLKL